MYRLPAGAVFVSAQPTNVTVGPVNGLISWPIGRMESASIVTNELTIIPTVPGSMSICAVVTANNDPFHTDDEICFTVLVTGCRLEIRMTSAGFAELTLHGETNQTYDIQASEDAVQWTTINTEPLTGPTATIIDAVSKTESMRFYRALQR